LQEDEESDEEEIQEVEYEAEMLSNFELHQRMNPHCQFSSLISQIKRESMYVREPVESYL